MSGDYKYTDEFFKEYENKYMSYKKSEVNKKAKRKKKHNYKLLYYVVVFIVSFLITFFSIKKPTVNENINQEIALQKPETDITAQVKFNYTEPDATTVLLGADVDSAYAVFLEADSLKIIAEKNYNKRIYPASMTKIMTLLVAVENIKDFNDTFTMTNEIIDPLYINEASLAGFSGGEDVKIIDLLYGSILPSGAEATCAIANYVSGSEAEFVKLMNNKVAELGLKNTHFANTSGLHSQENYSTVYDMALILKAAMQNELACKVLSTYQYTTSATPQHPEGILLTSTLFSRMVGDEAENGAVIIGGKTGFVSESGNCIASFGRSLGGKNYIFVTADANGLWKSVYDHINTYSKYAN
ncbi:MAG: D-alanyl-D-alanine carboxypeptidase [Clostridia bacterium]|nr:D-alanyl-D-alanine carboxypeptidase [Clostridia bacterium]